MTLAEHQPLWNKIQQFAFDDPNATITFSKKLADQQRWPASYTERVIEEYRRFIFLCCISPNGASPSKAVDEAWHLHLTYTQSYWNAFCKNTLGKDIHHYPSNGGEQEDHKHTNWYAETLSLYASIFFAPPPADIWPSPVKQEQVNVQSLPQPEQPYQMGKGLILTVVILVLSPFVISYLITGIISPFSLKGPQFLLFYALLIGGALLAHRQMRQARYLYMKRTIDAVPLNGISIFQLANIIYGQERAVQTALVDLYRRELVSVNEDERKIIGHQNKYRAPEKEENPLIPALLANPDESWVYYTDIEGWCNSQSFAHPAIAKIFNLGEDNEPRKKRYLLIGIVLLIGLARILQGWNNDRPVGLLFVEVIALGIGAGLLSYTFSVKTYAFTRLKEHLLDKAGSSKLHPDQVVNDFALNGRLVLDWQPATLMLASMFVLFPVPPPPVSGGGSSSDSSCSSSCSSGGGGGCGGCSGSGSD
ncbi:MULTISPECIES: hypothetical protein [Niastella]|uniref:TIGR04222 domain-containing membrane protein n=1 Tax=Niastella soli TaxID=2821487 RepID=A0ABS3YS80_9BACT|nr:hypothetical protein [Niastella soli]MBO9200753.1 hypothetical protein [Niastella soli]